MVNWYGKPIFFQNNWTCNRYCLYLSFLCVVNSSWAANPCSPHTKQQRKKIVTVALRLVWTQHDTTYFWYVWSHSKFCSRVKSQCEPFSIIKYFESFDGITELHNIQNYLRIFCRPHKTQSNWKFHSNSKTVKTMEFIFDIKWFSSNIIIKCLRLWFNKTKLLPFFSQYDNRYWKWLNQIQ